MSPPTGRPTRVPWSGGQRLGLSVDRIARIAGPAVLLLVGFVSLLVALVIGGGADRALIADPGAVVRFGLPIARLVVDLSAAATIGGLALTVVGLSRSRPEWDRAIDVAAGAAGVWTVAAAVTTFFTFLSVAGRPSASASSSASRWGCSSPGPTWGRPGSSPCSSRPR